MESQEQSLTNKRKTSKTSVACAACKSRKTKCSGGPPPCTSCERLHTKCVIYPGSDMRRRDSKDHFKAYKALLDAFVSSTRSGDVELSTSLYRAIQLTDTSGKLAEVAQSYSQAVISSPTQQDDRSFSNEFEYKFGRAKLGMPSSSLDPVSDSDAIIDLLSSATSLQHSPNDPSERDVQKAGSTSPHLSDLSQMDIDLRGTKVDAACQTDRAPHWRSNAHGDVTGHHFRNIAPENLPFNSFEELYNFWTTLDQHKPELRVQGVGLLPSTCDPILLPAKDPLSQTITDFRGNARRAIQSGANTKDIIGHAAPSLEGLFEKDASARGHSVWSWACQFSQAFPELPLALQLGTIYMSGIQMRFLVFPCKETFDDLPHVLRPVRKQYTMPHAAGVDVCHLPVLKEFLFAHWDQHDSLLIKLMSGQTCNWPYSDEAMFAYSKEQSATTMSTAFIEHIRDLENYTISSHILRIVPQLHEYARD